MERINKEGNVLCSYCKLYKNKSEYLRLGTPKVWYCCSICRNKRRRELYKKSPDQYKKYRKKYYDSNKQLVIDNYQKYKKKNPEKVKESQRKWRKNNPNYKKNKRKSDLNYRVKENLRTRVHHAVKGISKKSDYTMNLIGCSIIELKKYLESQFIDNMSWDNYGKWHIDHIKPCSLFDMTDKEQQKECFNYKNLQPLWAEDNLKKNNKYE